MRRKLTWYALNGLFAVAMYFAYFKQVSVAENLVTFWTWYLFIISFVFLSKAVRKKIQEKGRTVHCYIDASYDLVMICIFIWFEANWLGFAYFTHAILTQTAYEINDEYQKEDLK